MKTRPLWQHSGPPKIKSMANQSKIRRYSNKAYIPYHHINWPNRIIPTEHITMEAFIDGIVKSLMQHINKTTVAIFYYWIVLTLFAILIFTTIIDLLWMALCHCPSQRFDCNVHLAHNSANDNSVVLVPLGIADPYLLLWRSRRRRRMRQ